MSASASSAASAADALPSLAFSRLHALAFSPSLLPIVGESSIPGGLRDTSAEALQQRSILQCISADLSLLLRLPLTEFLSHAIYNKSLQRCLDAALTQLPSMWELATKEPYYATRWASKDDADDEKTNKQTQTKPAVDGEQVHLLRSLAKRVLLVYVRICSSDSPSPAPAWLTPLWFTTSFSASPLFSAASLLDLVSFYSAVESKVNRPLLQFIVDRVATSMPFAFTTALSSAFSVLTSALQGQLKALHAPYNSNKASAGSGKPRVSPLEIKQFTRNVSDVLWSLYSMTRLRPELSRLLLAGLINSDKGKKDKTAPPTPPFLHTLVALYTLTPLLILHESGLKYTLLSAQSDLMSLRRGCMRLLHLMMRRQVYAAMGVRIVKKRGGGVKVEWTAPAAIEKTQASQAGSSSTLPPAYTLPAAAELFSSIVNALYTVVHEPSPDGLLWMPTPMRNLVSWNTSSTMNAFLKRYNEFFELDMVLMCLREQAKQGTRGTPGTELGVQKIEKMLNTLATVDAPLLKERVNWPPAVAKSSSSSAPPAAALTRSSSSKNAPDLSLQISMLQDLFPSYSADFLSACLSEYNADTEATTQAIVEQKLPAYLANVRDKAKYVAGDQMDKTKLLRPDGIMSRQTSSGSGILDEAVDSEDEDIARSSLDPDDDGGFEAFLKRTGRVSKEVFKSNQQQPKKAAAGSIALLNSFDKEDATLLANKIQASLDAMYEDEYDDAFDDFESFAVDGSDPLELEERANKSIYDSRGNDTADGGDEPDGSFQRNNNSKQQPRNQQGDSSSSSSKPQQPTRGFASMRGARGGAIGSSSARGGRSDNFDNVAVPRNFQPQASAPAGAPVDVRDQWRRDEERRELYVATMKAQKAQAIAPQKRTAEQSADLEHGLRHGLIQSLDAQPAQKGGNKGQQQQQPKQQQQQQQPARLEQPSARGGFSIRGGRGGAGAGRSGLNSSAAAFQPSGQSQSHAAPTGDARFVPSSNAGQQQSQPQKQQQQQQPRKVKANWNDSSEDEADAPVTSANPARGQQQPSAAAASGEQADSGDDSPDEESAPVNAAGGNVSHAKGGAVTQPMDARQRKRKEKNKAQSANHNRKQGALRKQGGPMF